jgi:hypothetical protein
MSSTKRSLYPRSFAEGASGAKSKVR